MFIFKIWNIIFPQASKNENTGFNISRGKYAFKALPEPACNVNRQTINSSGWPQSGPAILQSRYCRLHVSWHKEGLPFLPAHPHPCLLTKKVLVLNTRSPLSIHCWMLSRRSWSHLAPAEIKRFRLMGNCCVQPGSFFLQTTVPLYYYLSADEEEAHRCFVPSQRGW